jgi:hypothetical protein
MTKCKRVALILALGLYAATGLAAEVAYKGVPLNSSLSSFKKAFPSFTCEKKGGAKAPLTCVSEKETYGELPTTKVEAEFWDNTLKHVGVVRVANAAEGEHYFGQWFNLLIRKLQMMPKNKYGDSSSRISYEWEFADGSSVHLGKQCGEAFLKDEQCDVRVALSAADYLRLLNDEFREKSSKRVKDM